MQRRSLATFGLGATRRGRRVCPAHHRRMALRRRRAAAPRPAGGVAELDRRPDACRRSRRLPEALPAFDDCAELRQLVRRGSAAAVGPWGFGRPARSTGCGPVPLSARPGRPVVAAVRRPSEARRQQRHRHQRPGGRGRRARRRQDRRPAARARHSATTWSSTTYRGDRPRQLSRIELPGPHLEQELLLRRRHACWSSAPRAPVGLPAGRGARLGLAAPAVRPAATRTHLTDVDLSAPGAPVIVQPPAGRRRLGGGAPVRRRHRPGRRRAPATRRSTS